MDRFKKLSSGEIAWDSIREYVKEHNDFHRCLTCGRAGFEHARRNGKA